MQGWAKGLKDRVERTATQLSTQASTAFTPSDEEEQANSVSQPLVTTTSSSGPAGNNTAQQGAGDANPSAGGAYLYRIGVSKEVCAAHGLQGTSIELESWYGRLKARARLPTSQASAFLRRKQQ